MMIRRAFLVGLVLIGGLIAAADAQEQGQSSQTFKHFRVLLYSGEHVQGRDAVLSAGEFSGRRKDGGELTVSADEIKVLDVAQSTKAASYAGIGAMAGLLTLGLAILQVEADPDTELKSDAVIPMGAALTGVGALIGALVGSNAPNWERLPISTEVGVAPEGRGVAWSVAISF